LSKKYRKTVFSENTVPIISRYKVMLFSEIEWALRKKRLTLKYSYRYRASHTYMISDEQWNQRRNEFIMAAGLDKYSDGRELLSSMGKALTDTYEAVNARSLANENEYLTICEDDTWKLKDSEPNFDASKYIPQLLSESKPTLLYELLSEIDKYTEFTESFNHHSVRHSSKEVEKKLIFGTLMSLGTNLGHTDLAKAARGLTEKQLRDTEKFWFTEESLLRTNQKIVKFIQNLPLPTIYNGIDNMLHTSSDGKKVVVAVNSLLANYSYKYYGKEQGITVNSFLDNKQTFFHVNVLTSSDREAPYMMDGLVKSTSSMFREVSLHEQKTEDHEHLHSTDTHGYTEAIFAGLHFFDVAFAPRIAKANKQTIYAYEAKSLRKNTTNPIAPKTAINKKLILDNWDDILRLMATIKLNYCSASQIFKMLSASSSDSPLYAALKEFGRLIKSKFILNYIDDEELRRSITKQLNRVELGQKLAGKVFYGRGGHIYVGTSTEMLRVMLCKTILQNAIILWNYLFLSDYYNSLDNNDERRVVSEMISKGSVIAWKHVNMMGIFDFDHDVPRSFKSTIKQMMSINIVDWDKASS
jgi:TnpA family transposase